MFRIGTVRVPALALAAAAACLAVALACRQAVPAPAAGAPEYQEPGWVAVPFGRASVLGGNLQVARRDLDFDTRLGNVSLGAVWNSADARWREAFDVTWDGATFVDAAGTVHDARAVADGAAIPGTVWVRLDARRLRTKGGLVHEFDAAGRLEAVRFASGTYPRLEYRRAAVAGAPRVVELRQLSAAGSATRLATFAYDAAGRLAAVEDRAGRRAELTWDAEGRLVAARDAFDVESARPGFRYGYDQGRLASIVSSDGVRAEYRYTSGRRLDRARWIGAGDPATTFAYESLGVTFRTTVTDPLGAATRWEWDRQRRLLALVNPTGERTVWTWSGLRPASETRADGVVTRWEWSGDDLAVERQPSGNVVRFTWETSAENRDHPGRRAPRRIVDSLGLVAERSYDAAGRVRTSQNGAGETLAFAWSDANLLAAATDAAGIVTSFRDYGEHGHARRVERGDRVEAREYDAVGNPVFGTGSATLPGAGDTGVVSRRFDADRNLRAVVLAEIDQQAPLAIRTLTIERRSDGQPIRIERPNGGDSVFVYDALGRPIERRDYADGAWRATRFEWDLSGRKRATERPNGMRSDVAWDAAGRRRSVTHRRGAAIDSHASVGWEAGRLATIVDSAHGNAPERYAYDAAGRVGAVVFPDGERLELSYDLRSRVVRERYLGSNGGELRRLHFTYDLADREVGVRDGTVPLRTLRIVSGRVAEERFANGLFRSYAYSPQDGLVKAIEMRDAAGAVVESSRLAQEPPGVTWRYSTTTSGTLAATTHERFTLGPVAEGEPGARVLAYSAAAAGLFTKAWAYDTLGNVTRLGAAADPERTFHYDPTGSRLKRIRNGNGAVRHEYEYDEAGYVVERDGAAVEWDGAGNVLSTGAGARLRWDAFGRLVSSSLDGRTQRRLFGGRVFGDASGAPVAIELGVMALDLFGNHRFRHLDFRGNVKLVSDAAGRIVFHARHAPYGRDLEVGAPDPEAGFAGGSAAGADLVRLGSRLYDPDAARFLAPDPVFQLVNQYAYADGNPIWFWDPDGRSARLATSIALGAALGTACVGAIIGVPAVTIFAFAFAIGVVAPPNLLALAGAGAVAGAIRYAGGIPGVGAIFGGFAAGQTMGGAIQSSFGDSGLWDRFGDRPDQPDFPRIAKEIELRAEFGAATGGVGGDGGGVGGGGGCSPTALASTSPRVARRVVFALLGLQGLLAAIHLARRRTSEDGT